MHDFRNKTIIPTLLNYGTASQNTGQPVEQQKTYIQHILAIIDCFSASNNELGVREVARILGFSKSTTGRLMKELKNEGVLTQNPDTALYRLGARVIKWAGVYMASSDLCRQSLPYMRHLLQETNETISLYTVEGNERICVERLESHQNVRIVEQIGQRLKLYAGSGGRAILAFMQPDEIGRILAIAEQEIPLDVSPEKLSEIQDQLKEIRKSGYSISHGQWLDGASGIAAPIFGKSDTPIGSISISGPTARFSDMQTIDRYRDLLLSDTYKLSKEMGFETSISIPD